MGRFEAKITTDLGVRAIRLSWFSTIYDRRKLSIEPTVLFELDEFPDYPFCYQYIEATKEREYDVIKIIAAPGVTIELHGWKFTPETERLLLEPPVGAYGRRQWLPGAMPDLQILRVQDAKSVPPIGADITSFSFTGTEEIGEFYWTSKLPQRYFLVSRTGDGVVIQHPTTNTQLLIRVPRYHMSDEHASSGHDAFARFAFEIGTSYPWLRIVKSGPVEIIASGLKGRPRDPGRFSMPVQIWEVDEIFDVPPQGQPILPRRRGWREITERVTNPPKPRKTASGRALGIRAAFSFIPVIGDLIDLAELGFAKVTGKDFLFQDVDNVDLALMAAGVMLPFVGGATLRAGERAVRAFGDRAVVAERVANGVKRANLTEEEIKLLRQIEGLVVKGARPTQEALDQYLNLLHKIEALPRKSVDDILNAAEDGFTHAELQQHYQEYWAGKLWKGEVPAKPREYALRFARGRPRAILEQVLGKDYVARAKTLVFRRPINIVDIPRPPRLTDQIVRNYIDNLVKNSRDKLTERLVKFFAKTPDDAVGAFLYRRQINPGIFYILKGNLAEIFSLPTQRAVLKEINKENPYARIVSGIRMRLKKSNGLSKALLFTDNIVVFERGGNLYLRAVSEVKSGLRGGQEATEQVFDWIEKRVTEGSQIVIPRGSKIIAADGTEKIMTRERNFLYDPTSKDKGRVIWLQSAERHVITAKGRSALGVNSAMQIGPGVTRHELELTSEELDYLCGRIFATLFTK